MKLDDTALLWCLASGLLGFNSLLTAWTIM